MRFGVVPQALRWSGYSKASAENLGVRSRKTVYIYSGLWHHPFNKF
jgi:hypothetical protein